MHTEAQWTGLFLLHLSAQSQHTLFVSPGPVHVATRADTSVLSYLAPPFLFLSEEQKQGQQTSRTAHKCVMTATAKRVIVQWCFGPNQLLTGSMWSARGSRGAASHKDVLFGSRLSAKRSQPQIAPDTHTLGWTPAPAEPTPQLIVTLSESDPLCSWQHML